MKNLRVWAIELSLIIMLTGIFIKLFPQKSERQLLRFVCVMVIFTCIFQTNFSSFSLSFDKTIKENIENDSEALNKEISELIDTASKDEITKTVEAEVFSYDANAKVKTVFEENSLKVYITSKIISSNDINAVKENLIRKLNLEITVQAGESVEK